LSRFEEAVYNKANIVTACALQSFEKCGPGAYFLAKQVVEGTWAQLKKNSKKVVGTAEQAYWQALEDGVEVLYAGKTI
jgi:hypothetical protein